LIGKNVMRFELPTKVNGAARYSIDVEVPGMVYGAMIYPPTVDSTIQSFSDDKAKRDANQEKESQIKSGVEKNRIGPDPRSDQAALNLTSEEVRLIRDFIKPAPVTGTPAPAINVGDMVSIATIPLPSPLMEKIPKLLGARFAIKNGAIIIVRKAGERRHWTELGRRPVSPR